MTTYTSTRAGTDFPAYRPIGSGTVATAWATIEVSTAPAPADIFQMCKLPKGAVVLGGRLLSERLASGTSLGSTSLGWNVGFEGAFTAPDGTAYASTTASNALGTFGPIDYAAVTAGSIKPESGCNLPLGGLLYTVGPLTLTEEQRAIITCSTSATSFATGTMTLRVDFVVP